MLREGLKNTLHKQHFFALHIPDILLDVSLSVASRWLILYLESAHRIVILKTCFLPACVGCNYMGTGRPRKFLKLQSLGSFWKKQLHFHLQHKHMHIKMSCSSGKNTWFGREYIIAIMQYLCWKNLCPYRCATKPGYISTRTPSTAGAEHSCH